MSELVADQHLGGYMVGGDDGTFFPHIWLDLKKRFNLQSVIDIGCGEGYAARFFKAIGMDVMAIDGSEKVKESGIFEPIIIHDYAKDVFQPMRTFDLAWSAEFLEHVEPEYISNIMPSFESAKIIAFTAAIPGQGGYHHVSEQPSEYWIDIFKKAGYTYLKELTDQYRAMDEGTYFRISGLVFQKK